MATANDSLSVVKTCQEGTLVYPVRLALQTERLKACRTDSNPLCNLTEWQKDYERRLLRAGYVYILALDVAPEEKPVQNQTCMLGIFINTIRRMSQS
ncbi:Uncharacterised protein [Rodentibacter pneumotropicus]|uniref:Uncharacterized protein n=1 Tax=Rodentibacter pneumotropicus TaxID=758 RepID=A0A3S4U7D7_9PAST|nr:Uncharacterised protein [Rodentibacter pneumotropicus]